MVIGFFLSKSTVTSIVDLFYKGSDLMLEMSEIFHNLDY